ncbi:hypothetical protein TNCV_2489491 [Trichonephila clavipes]|nr:hypothetical protein TNCV_2489491 [Trichonephila clavipes]
MPRQPSGQGTDLWLTCHEFEPSTPEDPPFIMWLEHRSSTPRIQYSNPGLGKSDSAIHALSGSIKCVPRLPGNLTLGVSHQTDHLTGTFAHAPHALRSRILSWGQ